MISLQAEELTDAAFIQLGADDAQTAHHVGSAVADIPLAGDEVEVDPLAVTTCHDALGTQNDAVLAGIQLLQNGADLLSGVFLGSLAAPGGEDLVGVVVMMVMVVAAAGAVFTMLVMVVMMLMLVVMVVTAAALLTMLVMMVMLMLMVMMLVAALGRLMAVVMLVAALVVMVMAAAALLTMLMVVVMLMLVVMTAAAMLLMLVVMVMLLLGGLHVLFQGVLALEGGDELLTA